MDKIEIWKDVLGYEGLYEISNFGRVKSLQKRHKQIKILQPACDNAGYLIVTLCKNKQKKTKSIHRLLMISFYGNQNKDVNHKDGDKKNCHIDNLEYVTKSENTRHAIMTGLLVPNTTKIGFEKRKIVLMICPDSKKIIERFISAHDAAKKTGYNRGNISNACRNGTKIYNKFWQYATP